MSAQERVVLRRDRFAWQFYSIGLAVSPASSN